MVTYYSFTAFIHKKITILFIAYLSFAKYSATRITVNSETCVDGKHLGAGEKPNIIILLADDLGFGDLSCYGHPNQEYGGIDRMAAEGIRFTSFYSADSMCSPSRAGLLTGRLPIRIGITGITSQRVFRVNDTGGLPQSEITLAEALKSVGYATGMVGKWHLGINANNYSDGSHLPSKHGFDFVGYNLPFTNVWECDETGVFMKNGPDLKQCFLYRGDKIVQQPINHDSLTNKLLDDYKIFVKQNSKQPFFFYFSFPHVHTDLFASPPFKNSSKRGLFGDNLNEMHWAVDQVLKFLTEEKLESKTMVIFLSDHGPHQELCELGGVTGGFKGGKKSSFEGGFRIPVIVRWPGVVDHGKVSQTPLSALDLFPTLFRLAGGQSLPESVSYDGMDVSEILLGKNDVPNQQLKERLLFFYCSQSLLAVRYMNLKFHLASHKLVTDEQLKALCPDGMPLADMYTIKNCNDQGVQYHNPPLVYDLTRDPFENYPVDITKVAEQWKSVENKINLHKKNLVIGNSQLGNMKEQVFPCCDYPKCGCNYP